MAACGPGKGPRSEEITGRPCPAAPVPARSDSVAPRPPAPSRLVARRLCNRYSMYSAPEHGVPRCWTAPGLHLSCAWPEPGLVRPRPAPARDFKSYP